MTRKQTIISVLVFLCINTLIHAQVTIGSDIEPSPGSLLDLKENSGDDDNTTKGIMLPRVRLSDLNNLYPMFATNTDYKNKKSELDHKHIGLIVYNVNESAPFKKGLYYWDGDKWVHADPAVWKTMGNAGTDPNVNYLGTSDKQPLVLKANNKEGLRIDTNGEAILVNAPVISNSSSQVLVRNAITGNIGVATAIPTKLMLVQSETEQSYAKDTGDSPDQQRKIFNNGGIDNARAILWKSEEVETNNIVEEEPHAAGTSFEYFVIKEKGSYEVSGFISYEPNCQYISYLDKTLKDTLNTINTALAAVNVAIQKQETGTSVWKNIAATRVIWSGQAITGTSSTAAVPPITVHFEPEDKIRLIFYRPSNVFGRPHGKGGNWGITYVFGIDIKKGMRVMMVDDDKS
ncbi:MAG: hypothetical protein LBL58_11890 [Tannerellaceae bacterium]|jgi:hypothetical protein|nr:hypothetical protein [Tannerellaceae bacterium]